MKKRSVVSWVLEFAGRKRAFFGGSILLAMLGDRVQHRYARCDCGKR